MEDQILLILLIIIVFILGGGFVFILLSLLPLINQTKKTARQLEITAESLDTILNDEIKVLLKRGDNVFREFEEITGLVKNKLTHVPGKATEFAFKGIGPQLARTFLFWSLRGAWRKIRGTRGKGVI